MAKSYDLKVEQLRVHCDESRLDFSSTADLPSAHGLTGQDRALNALQFGVSIDFGGYNIYAPGAQASGRHRAVRRFVEDRAAERPAPDDWIYVHNFREAYRPKALRLPPGRGGQFEGDLNDLVANLKSGLQAVFESDEYRERRGAIDSEFQQTQQTQLAEISKRASAQGLAVIPRPNGMAVLPVREGKPVPPEELEQMPEKEKQQLQASISELMEEIRAVLEAIPQRDKLRREAIQTVNRESASRAANRAMAELFERYKDVPDVFGHLEEIRDNIVENAEDFLHDPEEKQLPVDQTLNRYRANALIKNDKVDGAPVVYADFPDIGHLLGRIEHIPHMGAMLTDFTLIKPGALHRANGGFLLIDAERLLTSPFAWQAMKRCLRSRQIAIESPTTGAATLTAVTLEPEPIPLDIKVILFGQRQTLHLMSSADPDFDELFKVAAEFDDTLPRTEEHELAYCKLIAAIVDHEKTHQVSVSGCAAIIDRSARIAGDNERLSLRVGVLADLVREADFWAQSAGADTIERAHVERAVAEQIHRLDLVRQKTHEAVTREIINIDTQGSEVGQVNGLAVLQTGKFAFGKPNRITANVRMGKGRVVDIEREVEMGGPLHSKGVLILSGFLTARYAPLLPLSLAASLVFEQSYGGVDGDSASSAELYALLSALAEVPILQSIAVTGSVNQKGEVQAIGGVNEKIEGFFDICASRGLTGDQAVMIPGANIKHLMVADRVTEAVANGKFAVYAVDHIDAGMEILTGRRSGIRNGQSSFPEGTVNCLVEQRLTEFAQARRDFAFRNGDHR